MRSPTVYWQYQHGILTCDVQDNGEHNPGDESDYDEASEILEDIQEALSLARLQGVLPPVRIARILAGEGTGQFSSPGAAKGVPQQRTVPLSVALDYVGAILDDSRKEIGRLKSEVEEYNQLCNSMEKEVESLLRASHGLPAPKGKNSFFALFGWFAPGDLTQMLRFNRQQEIVEDQCRGDVRESTNGDGRQRKNRKQSRFVSRSFLERDGPNRRQFSDYFQIFRQGYCLI